MAFNQYNGHLNSNEIFSSIYNMILSQRVFADNIASTFSTLADQGKYEVGMYGDTALFYATDVLRSTSWKQDEAHGNLLATDRPADPDCQEITIDQFRQIALSVDNYMTKRAWGTEGSFSEFTRVMLGWVNDTKRIYESTLYNTYIGTTKATKGRQNITLTLDGNKDAQQIAEGIANLLIELEDPSRDFNEYGNLRSFDASRVKVIWNSKWINKLLKVDMPVIFHKDGLIDKLYDYMLPARYFGTVKPAASVTIEGDRALEEIELNEVKQDSPSYDKAKHLFPGDLIPVGTAKSKIPSGKVYTADENIICKIVVELPKYLSTFEVGTSFFNDKNLITNHYLTWGYANPEFLYNYPFITVKKA